MAIDRLVFLETIFGCLTFLRRCLGAHTAADQISGSVRDLSRGAVDGGQQSAKAIGTWIEEKPVLAFLIAVGVGYVGVRALLR